ncbi:TPA: hypothetical protein ACP69B_003591, partial [Escherichia coli]
NCPLTDFGGKTSIFSHPVYLFLRKFSLQDFRGGSLSRLAAKQGFSGEDAIVDMLGTDIAYYNGEDKGVFMLAKRFTALSFGCFRHDGENITVVLSRDGDSQSHDLEILGKVFVVAEAATTIKMGTGSATAVLPVVKRLKFTKTEA